MKETRNHLKTAIIVAILALPLLGTAQQDSLTRNLTLQEAITMSIKHSGRLKIDQAKIDEATGALQEAKDARLPNAGISGAYLRLNRPNVSLKTKLFGSSSDTTSGGSSGGSSAINQAVYGMANVSIPIFTGGKIRYGIQSAEFLEKAATLDAAHDQSGLILNTIDAYVNLYKATVTVQVVRENLNQSMKRDSVLSRLEETGILARNDLLKAKLQTSNIQLEVMDAESNLKIASINMDLMLGFPEQTLLIPDPSGFDQKINLKNLEDYENSALQGRNDLQALSYREKAATAGIAAAKSDLYPSLALTGGFIAADIPHFLSVSNALNVGIGVKYDLASLWKAKARISQAQAQQKEVLYGEGILADAIRLTVHKAYEDYLLASRKISVYELAVSQAEENYRITRNKFDNNLVNTTDLLDANVLLLQSKINLAVAKADMVLAYDHLLTASGMISTNN